MKTTYKLLNQAKTEVRGLDKTIYWPTARFAVDYLDNIYENVTNFCKISNSARGLFLDGAEKPTKTYSGLSDIYCFSSLEESKNFISERNEIKQKERSERIEKELKEKEFLKTQTKNILVLGLDHWCMDGLSIYQVPWDFDINDQDCDFDLDEYSIYDLSLTLEEMEMQEDFDLFSQYCEINQIFNKVKEIWYDEAYQKDWWFGSNYESVYDHTLFK